MAVILGLLFGGLLFAGAAGCFLVIRRSRKKGGSRTWGKAMR